MAQSTGYSTLDFGAGSESAYITTTYDTIDNPPNLFTPGWGSSTLPSSAAWRGAEFGNSTYFTYVPSSTTAATSSDGITWTARTLPAANAWSGVAFGNGCFVLVSTTNNTIYRSTDAITWNPYVVGAGSFTGVKYVNGLFFLSNGTVSTSIYTSSDGITWNTITTPSASISSFAYGNGTYVAIPASSTTTSLYSTNGTTWTTSTIPITAPITGIEYGNGYFLISQDNSSASTMRSVDGINWQTITRGSILNTTDVRFSSRLSKFVFVAGTSGVFLSNDGTDMQLITVPTAGTGSTKISFAADKFLLTSSGGTVFAYSGDGISRINASSVSRNTSPVNTTIRSYSAYRGSNTATLTITGQTGIQSTDSVQVWLMGENTINNHNVMEHLITPIKFRITSVTAGVGFTIQATSPYRLTGTYKIRWAWSS